MVGPNIRKEDTEIQNSLTYNEAENTSYAFQEFCGNLIPSSIATIFNRQKSISKRLNTDFWQSDSETNHTYFVGSFGRGTAVNGFSNVDMIFELPAAIYWQYNNYIWNGQSCLLQAVKNSIAKTYWNTDVGGDGQVVVVNFSDGTCFEIVPAIVNKGGTFTFPDSNDGGKWKTTNPLAEINAIDLYDTICNGTLRWLCRMARAWKKVWNVPIGGLLIDTLAYKFMLTYEYYNKGFAYYDWISRDFFKFLADQRNDQSYWNAIGSNQQVYRKGSFEWKAKRCYNLSLEAIDYMNRNMIYSATAKWREIYGTTFPQ